MKGLAPHTAKIIETISQLDCIKPYVLVGGSALSLQLHNRLSEDLDFMSWRTRRDEKREVDWPEIRRQLEEHFVVEKCEILGFDHIEFMVEGVKLSFYANPNYSPVQESVPFLNNIVLADILSIGAMKIEVLMRRSTYRDYYDIYSILEHGVKIRPMIDLALKYSGHRLKTKNLLAILTNHERFVQDSNFEHLQPTFSITPKEISNRIAQSIGSDY